MVHAQDNAEEICSLLRDGEVILYPTDAGWAIGCDATNPAAIERMNKLRKKTSAEPVTILVDDVSMLRKYVRDIHPRIETLVALHQRPLTIVYPGSRNLPDILTGGRPEIGIRIVQDPFCLELISGLGNPIVDASASLSGQTRPANFGKISSELIKAVDYVVKYRQENQENTEQPVVATYNRDGELEFLES